MKNEKIELRDPTPKRDFVFVTDAVKAVEKICLLEGESHIFNIGSSQSISIHELTRLILKHANLDLPISYSNEKRVAEINEIVANISLAKSVLNWYPEVSIDDGIKMILDALKT